MEQWRVELLRGRNHLTHHEPQKAISNFKEALKLCPPCDRCGSAKILFYMGIALKRVGHYGSAVKLWISANRIKKNRLIKKMIERYANGYGMLKQATGELDDRNAFFSTQISRYLEKKHNRKFSTHAEQDVVLELLEDYWKSILKNAILIGKSIEEKREIYHKITIPFPYLFMPKCIGDSVVSVNFKKTNNENTSTRCYCGSGLPFAMCCGRTPVIDELVAGVF